MILLELLVMAMMINFVSYDCLYCIIINLHFPYIIITIIGANNIKYSIYNKNDALNKTSEPQIPLALVFA